MNVAKLAIRLSFQALVMVILILKTFRIVPNEESRSTIVRILTSTFPKSLLVSIDDFVISTPKSLVRWGPCSEALALSRPVRHAIVSLCGRR